jgi:hypothetical protein
MERKLTALQNGWLDSVQAALSKFSPWLLIARLRDPRGQLACLRPGWMTDGQSDRD